MDFLSAPVFFYVKISNVKLNNRTLQLLVYFFHWKKSAIESHYLFVEAHGEAPFSGKTC